MNTVRQSRKRSVKIVVNVLIVPDEPDAVGTDLKSRFLRGS